MNTNRAVRTAKCERYNCRRAHRDLCADPHRSGGRHHRHLAALSLPPRRADAQRGDQPPRRARDSRHAPTTASSSTRRTPAPSVEADDWRELRDRKELRLLSLLAHFFEARGITLTTTSQSPAGAGIAGSSALNVAVCAALAEWKRTHYEPEALLQIAMNVEAQAINVPTGPAGLPPGALRRDRRRSSSRSTASTACRSTSTSPSSNSASSSATPASRATRAPTTGRSPRGTSTATGTSSTASSAFATRRPPCARHSSAATGTRSDAPSPTSGRTASGSRRASRRRPSRT